MEVLHGNWKKALGNIFSEYSPVFIGYAGNDNSLMDYLVENGEKFSNKKEKVKETEKEEKWGCPYWMLYDGDKIEGKVAEFLDKAEGYCINHSGFDEALIQMGAALGYKIPSREAFIGDAEKRYAMLSDAIDSVADKSVRSRDSASGAPAAGESAPDISSAVRQITGEATPQSVYSNAVMLHNKGKYEEALSELQKLIELEPDNARYHNNLGNTLYEMKRYDEALAEVQKALELKPDNAAYHSNLGLALHAMKLYGEAWAAKQKAVELAPDNASYQYSLGVTLHEMKLYDEAQAAEQKAVELEPGYAMYHEQLGVTLHAMKRYEEALTARQKAVELEPGTAMYHNNLGVTLHAMTRYDEALAAKQKAVELEPDNALYHKNLGNTLKAMGRHDEALAEVQKADELEDGNISPDNED